MNKTLPLGRSVLIAAIVAIGIAAIWFMVANWCEEVVNSAIHGQQPFESVYLTVAGDPVLVRMLNGNFQSTEKIVSLDGKPLTLTGQDLLYSRTVEGPDKPTPAHKLDWQSRLVTANDGGVPPTYWYLVHDGESPGHAYGVGYHAPTRLIVGYFARKGFSESMPPKEQWFDIPGYSGARSVSTMWFSGQEPRYHTGMPRPLLLADGKLWKIDFVKRQLVKLLDCPLAYHVGQAWRILENPPLQSAEGDQRSASSVTPTDGLVREPEALVVVNPANGESKRYPVPVEVQKHQIGAAQLPDGSLLLITTRSYDAKETHVIWIKASGEVVQQQTVQRQMQWRRPSLAALGWWWAGNAPLPLVNVSATFVGMPLMVHDYVDDESIDDGSEDEDYGQALGIVLARTWPSILAVLAVACVTAALAYRRQKRFGLPNPAAWALFAFLFGVPGWIAYRFHRVWPVLEDCPACKQPAPRDRDTCFDCGKAFPPPPLKGIEVFA